MQGCTTTGYIGILRAAPPRNSVAEKLPSTSFPREEMALTAMAAINIVARTLRTIVDHLIPCVDSQNPSQPPCWRSSLQTYSPAAGLPPFSKKKPVTSASPIWQSADRKGLRRSLVCTTVIISSRWAFRSDGCSARGRAVADAEAGTAFRAIAIRAIAEPHEVIDKSSLSSTPSYERPYPTRFRASFLHLSLR